MDGAGARYVRLDADYLLHVRPFLTDSEARVYEAVVLECDRWDRPTSAATLAGVTRLHLDSVRRALRSLELIGLIRTRRIGPATSPHAQRAIEIVRQYDAVRAAVVTQKRRTIGDRGAPARGRTMPPAVVTASASSGSYGPELPSTLDRSAQRLWVERSRVSGSGDPDPSLARSSRSDPDPPSLPSLPGAATVTPSPEHAGSKEPRDVTNEQQAVPDELVALCRKLWTTDVTRKAARRYLGPLLAIGVPTTTVEELDRYLRSAAKANRVQRARFPIAAACMPEEFEDWLERSRRLRLVPPTRASPRAATDAATQPLTFAELGARAKDFCSRLARTEPNAQTTAIDQDITKDQEEAAP